MSIERINEEIQKEVKRIIAHGTDAGAFNRIELLYARKRSISAYINHKH